MTFSDAIESKINTIIGAVLVRKPQVYTDRGYECAAWWEERTSAIGVFPLYLRRDLHNKARLFVQASIPAKVSSDHFPAMFGGVAYSSGDNKRVGQSSIPVSLQKGFAEAVADSGAADETSEVMYCVHAEYHGLAETYCAALIEDAHGYLRQSWAKYQADDIYHSGLSAVSYAAEIIAKNGRLLHDLQRKAEFHKQYLDLWTKNTSWVKECA